MSADDNLSPEDKEFLAKCEEEFKDRFTEKDEEFMKVFNEAPSVPPIIKSWWVPQNAGRRSNRRYQPYDRSPRDGDRREPRDGRGHERGRWARDAGGRGDGYRPRY